MKIYINRFGQGQKETIDELNSLDFADYKAFKTKKNRLLTEYQISDNSAQYYISQRHCKGWN